MPGNAAIIAARPTILVENTIQLRLIEGLLDLLIVENTSGLYRCEAIFGNWGTIQNRTDFLYFDRTLLDFGTAFKVVIGADTIFDGRIVGIEAHFPSGGAPELVVLAEDRLQDLRMTRRTRTFPPGLPAEQVITDAQVIKQIASEHGLEAQVSVSGPDYKILAQLNQSDLAFLRERVRSIDAELWIDGKTLHASSHKQRNGGTLSLAYGNDLRAFSVLADLAGQRTSVQVTGWDRASKTKLQSIATAESISEELRQGSSGAALLLSKFGPRKEALAHTAPLTSAEADAIAASYFKMSARRFVVGHGIANPNAKLRVGNFVNLSDLGTLFSGTYYLSEVQHLFDGYQGMRTEFTAERPDFGQ
jgi:phage protein D